MKYALVLENSTEACNATSTLLASLGYLITPVFSPKKALHAAHMIQFDLIAISTTSIPGDRRCLAGELARCSPDATIILLADPEPGHVNGRTGGIRAVLRRPLAPHELQAVIEGGRDGIALQPPPCPERRGLSRERRRRAVD
jgi:DNA-binding response OmpR family regulator